MKKRRVTLDLPLEVCESAIAVGKFYGNPSLTGFLEGFVARAVQFEADLVAQGIGVVRGLEAWRGSRCASS